MVPHCSQAFAASTKLRKLGAESSVSSRFFFRGVSKCQAHGKYSARVCLRMTCCVPTCALTVAIYLLQHGCHAAKLPPHHGMVFQVSILASSASAFSSSTLRSFLPSFLPSVFPVPTSLCEFGVFCSASAGSADFVPSM